MTAVSALPDDVLALLLDAADEQSVYFAPRERFHVVRLCAEAVAFATEPLPTPVGVRARASAHVLFQLEFPGLEESTVEQLAAACERAALVV